MTPEERAAAIATLRAITAARATRITVVRRIIDESGREIARIVRYHRTVRPDTYVRNFD